MTQRMCERMLKEFYHPGAKWVIVNGKPLRIRTWESFIMQTLEFASNQIEFIVKRCHALMIILNHEPINVRSLIADNIKFMVDAHPMSLWAFLPY